MAHADGQGRLKAVSRGTCPRVFLGNGTWGESSGKFSVAQRGVLCCGRCGQDNLSLQNFMKV